MLGAKAVVGEFLALKHVAPKNYHKSAIYFVFKHDTVVTIITYHTIKFMRFKSIF